MSLLGGRWRAAPQSTAGRGAGSARAELAVSGTDRSGGRSGQHVSRRTCTTLSTVASTVPGNGDVNPYGVAVVPTTIGALHQGDVLVSNFNNQANLQGTGTHDRRGLTQRRPDGVRHDRSSAR